MKKQICITIYFLGVVSFPPPVFYERIYKKEKS